MKNTLYLSQIIDAYHRVQMPILFVFFEYFVVCCLLFANLNRNCGLLGNKGQLGKIQC